MDILKLANNAPTTKGKNKGVIYLESLEGTRNCDVAEVGNSVEW